MKGIYDLSAPRKYAEIKIDKFNDAIFDAKMNGYKVTSYKIGISVTIAFGLACTITFPAYAAGGTIQSKIWGAFRPVVDVMKGLGQPIVYLVETAGVLTMFFDKRKGIKIMKDGAIAYLVLQFLPIFLTLLSEVGGAIESGN